VEDLQAWLKAWRRDIAQRRENVVGPLVAITPAAVNITIEDRAMNLRVFHQLKK
jgi:hypothetical protein